MADVSTTYLSIEGTVTTSVASMGGDVSSTTASLSGTITLPTEGTYYTGDYTVTPSAHSQTTLETQGLKMMDDVVVLQIPYYETSNLQNGYTVYIADEV